MLDSTIGRLLPFEVVQQSSCMSSDATILMIYQHEASLVKVQLFQFGYEDILG